MAISKTIIPVVLIIACLGAFADEPKFPKIGLLYISGLDCDEGSSTNEVPNKSIQYFLTTESFYRLIIIDNSVESIRFPYPEGSWLQVINKLPDEPDGCSTAIAIQDPTLATAKYAMDRFSINAGKINKENEIYFWGH
jgi:hypothetical protein